MSLVFNRALSADGNTLYFIDATEYPVGGYDRNQLAIIGIATYSLSTGDQIVLPGSYLGETVESFSIDVSGKDGVYKGQFFAIPQFVGQALVEGDIVFVVADQQLQKYVSGVLEDITVESLLDETIDQTGEKYSLVTTQISIKRDELILRYLDKMKDCDANCCEYNEVLKAKREYDYVRVLRFAAFIEFCRANYVTAQSHIETGNEFGEKALEATV